MPGNQSNTNGSQCFLHSDNLTFTVVPAYILVISVLGIVFNVFVLMVFCLHKKACTVAEIYLSNLAGADLALVSCLPFWAESVRNNFNWLFSESLCKMALAVVNMNAFCSIYFLVLISIDRHVALVHPLSHKWIRRPFYVKLGCLIVWGLGLVFALPIFLYSKSVQVQSNVTQCILNYTKNQYLVSDVMSIMFVFIIPVSIISFCTVRIIQSLRNRVMRDINMQRTEQRATNLILIVLLAFLLCWVPTHVNLILSALKRGGILSCHVILIIFQQVSTLLAFFNSVLNPILYVTAGKNFRKRAKELFKQWNNKTTETFSLMSTRTRLTTMKASS